MSDPGSNRSVSIGGSVEGAVIQTGDSNTASVQYTKTTLPPAESVDIKSELATLRELLAKLNAPDQKKIERAAEDGEDEVAKPEPDKQEVGGAVERMLKYASQAEGFGQIAGKIGSHLTNIVGWLGSNWSNLLNVVGLSA